MLSLRRHRRMQPSRSTPARSPVGALDRGPIASYAARLGILALLPMMLEVFNDYWAFSSAQVASVDRWLYPGYFLHLKSQLLAFPHGYYGDRLSDLLPGFF